MTFRILKKGGLALTKALKGALLIGSFLILAWIAYCLTCLTEDWFSYSSEDAGRGVEIVLVKC